jgi:E3 ubiquitin-protein ligase RNF38/44
MLLLYTKHCKRSAAESYDGSLGAGAEERQQGSNSGVDHSVVESLPVFRFGVLRGRRIVELSCDGLQICLCKTIYWIYYLYMNFILCDILHRAR